MLILKANVADKKKQSFFKITKSVNYFWSDMKDAKKLKKYLFLTAADEGAIGSTKNSKCQHNRRNRRRTNRSNAKTIRGNVPALIMS
jgi:hypothetical protein